jgi:adenylate kinase family enzyme
MMQPTRIHIIGGMGSGKTTLAAEVGRQLGLPLHALDDVAYAPGGKKQSVDVRQAAAARIARTPAWVTEGVYLGWIEPLLERADLIVWLDVSWHVAVWRIVHRHVVTSWTGTNPHPGWVRLWRFARSARRYYTSDDVPRTGDDDARLTRHATQRALAPYWSKVRVGGASGRPSRAKSEVAPDHREQPWRSS